MRNKKLWYDNKDLNDPHQNGDPRFSCDNKYPENRGIYSPPKEEAEKDLFQLMPWLEED